jgi:hypothetical protein
MAISDANLASSEADVGSRNACYSVDALFYSLVDYGEAKVLSEVTKWRNKKHLPELSEIWKSSGSDKAGWNKSAKLSMKLFHHILEVLNKYQMLFPEQPLGYSNVEMKSV